MSPPRPATRIPPANLEAEAAVLGAMLLEGRDAVPRVVDTLRASDFFLEGHRMIYAAIATCFEQGIGVDALNVDDLLRQRGQLEAAGGPAKMALLMEQASITTHLADYVRIVRDMGSRRDGIQVGIRMLTRLYDAQTPVHEVLDDTESQVLDLAQRRDTATTVRVGTMLKATFEELQRRFEAKNPVTGLASGLDRLDRETAGFQPGDFILIAARPSMGKTALSLNIAGHASIRNKKRGLICSLEMATSQLMLRLLAAEAHVDVSCLRVGQIYSSDWHRLTAAGGRLDPALLFIDDSTQMTVMDVRARARRLMAEHGGLDYIMVDYLQLMKGQGASREQEVASISRGLKALAKDLQIPVIAMAQLSRAVEARGRGDHRPQLSDLRESGALEQDADVILFLYRRAFYDPECPAEEMNVAEIIIGKQRNGPTGVVKTVFLPQYARFDNLIETDRREP